MELLRVLASHCNSNVNPGATLFSARSNLDHGDPATLHQDLMTNSQVNATDRI